MQTDYLKAGRASDLTKKSDRIIYRALEIMPGFFAWFTIIFMITMSFVVPVFVAIFIILFDIYWFFKTLYLFLHLRSAFNRMRKNMRINWLEKLEKLPTADYSLKTIKSWQDIYHLIFLPMYKEDIGVVSASLEGLIKSNYPKNRMIIVLALEERAGKDFNDNIKSEMIQLYGDKFLKFYTIEHPGNIEGEQAGKGSNIAYAGRWAKDNIIDQLQIPYHRVLVSAFDVDTVVYPEYFSCLTHTFLTSPDPMHASYQPIPFYTNNIWEAPAFARVVSFASTFWHTIKQERFDSAASFSSHSMPWQALVDIDFWQVNMVSEDSRIFWQCFLHYNGNYRIQPLYYPVSMDAAVAPTFWGTLRNVYKQQRRWGYGVENLPYFLFGFWKRPKIPKFKKWFYGFIVVEGFWSWATNAIMIFMLGWLPVVVGGEKFNSTVLSYNLPTLTRTIMAFSMFGLVSMAILSIFILPPKPPKFGKLKSVWLLLQWILFPVTTVVLGAFPGLEAQTRLMLGKYMGFWVTPKLRRNPKDPVGALGKAGIPPRGKY